MDLRGVQAIRKTYGHLNDPYLQVIYKTKALGSS